MSKDLIGIARSRSPAYASRKGWALGLLGLACGAACSACGESDGGPVPASDAAADTLDAGFEADVSRPDAEAGTDVGPDATDADADADAPWDGKPDGCDAMAPHPAVPEGWERWNGWSCDCPLFLPGTTGQMPPPIEWEPCKETVTAGLSCRRMKHTWNETGPNTLSFFPKMSIDPTSGAPLLSFGRLFYEGNPDVVYRIVAEADGPVRNAFMKVNPAGKGCGVYEEALNEGRYVSRAYGDTWDGPVTDPNVPLVEGAVAGHVGETEPSTVLKLPPGLPSTWSASSQWLVQWTNTQVAWSWDLKSKHTIYDPATDPDHLPGWRPFPIGEDVMVEVGDGRPAGVMTWNVNDGLRPLIRWYGDANQAAGNFGTDGKDMVWTYVAGKDLGSAKYETMSVMTVPFSTSAAEVEATSRRLRSDVKGFEPDGWVVGCGYAARGVGLSAPLNNALFIVRLSDGVSWTLPGRLAPNGEHWGNVLGITCDEVFATMAEDTIVRLLRFRLDSLGPGTPPD